MGTQTVISEGILAQTMRAAILERDKQRLAGATSDELARNLEQTVRAAWPFVREWKYLCQDCRDYGLMMRECPGDASCGRNSLHLVHEFGVPCWCSVGNRFKTRPKAEQDFTAATKAKRQPSRFGQ